MAQDMVVSPITNADLVAIAIVCTIACLTTLNLILRSRMLRQR